MNILSIPHHNVVEPRTPPNVLDPGFGHHLDCCFGIFEVVDVFGFLKGVLGGLFPFQDGEVSPLTHLHLSLIGLNTVMPHYFIIIIM